MRYLEKYNNWILLLEKRDIKSREKLTVANRIVDLKKYNFDLNKPMKVIYSSSGQAGF